MTACKLYRHFAADGTLLYVGIADNALRRTGQHANKPWAGEIAKIEIENHETRQLALAAETMAIAVEHPKHNKQGVSSPIHEAAREMFRQGIASHSEIAELAGRSRQIVRHWVQGIPDNRAETVKAYWEEALEAVRLGID